MPRNKKPSTCSTCKKILCQYLKELPKRHSAATCPANLKTVHYDPNAAAILARHHAMVRGVGQARTASPKPPTTDEAVTVVDADEVIDGRNFLCCKDGMSGRDVAEVGRRVGHIVYGVQYGWIKKIARLGNIGVSYNVYSTPAAPRMRCSDFLTAVFA